MKILRYALIFILIPFLVGCGNEAEENPEETLYLDSQLEQDFMNEMWLDTDKDWDSRNYPSSKEIIKTPDSEKELNSFPKYPLQDGKGNISSPREPETARSNNY
jgi:hypothetical protein